MKKVTIILSMLMFSLAGFSQQPPQEKVFDIKLSESQLMAVLNLINEAKLDGETRRQFDKMFRDQALAQIQQAQPKQDTTKKQPPVKAEPKPEKKND